MSGQRVLLIHAFGSDPAVITGALRVARNASRGLPEARIRVVVQGPAVAGLVSGSGFDEDLADTRRGVIDVAACGNSMEREGIEQDQLTEGVTVVPSAVIHLAEQQWSGAAYVRV
ncbi:DsrE family protein [Microbacterium aerolatum]|uniref:DsrE family protein n=1 Tax=Microbacterium aerolatum TaxID=153731 RepID=UPI002000CE39|nr:DsrE family protein [Microbacterium aerolatum]